MGGVAMRTKVFQAQDISKGPVAGELPAVKELRGINPAELEEGKDEGLQLLEAVITDLEYHARELA
jgi:hypothetical protein